MSKETHHVQRIEVLMDAGFGAQKAGDILIRAFAHTGRYVFIEPMIPAEISPPARSKPALSGSIIRVGDADLTNIGNDTDLIIAQHEIVLDRRLDDEEHNPNCRVLLDIGDRKVNEESYEMVCKRATKWGLKIFPFDLTDNAKVGIKAMAGRGKNMYYLGMLSAIYNVPEKTMVEEIRMTFGKKLKEEILLKNIEIFQEGHKFATVEYDFSFVIPSGSDVGGEKILIDGNTALSMGIVDAGIKIVCGYPITPASSIMHTLARAFPSYGGMVHQAEDEISAIGSAIGAYFGGTPALTATSGPGLSLKQEFIGYASAAEIPIIIADIQRSGPSTGMPTKTEQSDLLSAIYGAHGDNTQVVIGVGNITDCFHAPKMARYFAEKLRLPVFIMSDFQMANSYKVVPKPKAYALDEDVNDIADEVLDYFGVSRLPDDIEMVRKDQSVPGIPGHMRRVTGLNTDDEGKVNYFAKSNQRSHAVRNEKIHHVQRSLNQPTMIGGSEEGDILIVGWGSTFGAIKEAVESCQKQDLKVGGICFKVIYPLPLMLADVFGRFKKVVTVELAFGDYLKRTPLAMFLRSKTLVDVTPVISRATGRPITPMTIETAIKEILNKD